MIALDSSVVVASFGAWHEPHTAARQILGGRPQLPAHAGLPTRLAGLGRPSCTAAVATTRSTDPAAGAQRRAD